MTLLDLGPATRVTAAVVAGVRDDQLGDPTPCPAYAVADLVDHVGGLARAFAAAARKQPLPDRPPPAGDGARLEDGWRDRITASLGELAEAWRDPAAVEGMTAAGGVDLPGEVAVLVALNEVVVHGWDLAVATGQAYEPDPGDAARCRGFAESFAPPPGEGPGLFGPPVAVSEEAPELDRLLGATGRRPDWTP